MSLARLNRNLRETIALQREVREGQAAVRAEFDALDASVERIIRRIALSRPEGFGRPTLARPDEQRIVGPSGQTVTTAASANRGVLTENDLRNAGVVTTSTAAAQHRATLNAIDGLQQTLTRTIGSGDGGARARASGLLSSG
jgi:hypothetical protein